MKTELRRRIKQIVKDMEDNMNFITKLGEEEKARFEKDLKDYNLLPWYKKIFTFKPDNSGISATNIYWMSVTKPRLDLLEKELGDFVFKLALLEK